MNPKNIITILVCPENPDNVGAAARAVKNMGFSELRIVNPPRQWLEKGKKMAVSAFDILRNAKSFSNLEKASADLQSLVGTTRRVSYSRGAFASFPEIVSKVQKISQKTKVGIVFGCESKGLANKDSKLCDYLVTIPTGKSYPSLNLAQAVMVMLFSIAFQKNFKKALRETSDPLLSKKDVGIALDHFEKALRALGYREGGAELLPRILQTMRGLIKRNGLLGKEAQMIKGLSRRIREKVLSAGTN